MSCVSLDTCLLTRNKEDVERKSLAEQANPSYVKQTTTRTFPDRGEHRASQSLLNGEDWLRGESMCVYFTADFEGQFEE